MITDAISPAPFASTEANTPAYPQLRTLTPDYAPPCGDCERLSAESTDTRRIWTALGRSGCLSSGADVLACLRDAAQRGNTTAVLATTVIGRSTGGSSTALKGY
jgi:hypothetical protein